MKTKLIVIISIGILFLSCNIKKQIVAESDNFIGTWYSMDYVLIIEKDAQFEKNQKFVITDNYPNMEPINVGRKTKGDYIDGKIKFSPFGHDDISYIKKSNQIKYNGNLYIKKN